MRRCKRKGVGSRAALLSFKRPLLSVAVSVCLCVYLSVRNFDAEYLGN